MIGLALKKYYHCKLIPSENHGLKLYQKPIVKYGNYQPLSSYTDIAVYGKDIQNRWRLIVDRRAHNGEFSVGDLLYLDGVEPNPEEENGEGANAIISSISQGVICLTIEIESVVPRE